MREDETGRKRQLGIQMEEEDVRKREQKRK
jgi:hypothetical protein